MPIAEWNVPFVLQTPGGNLNLNDLAGPLYLLDATACDAGAEIRDTKENVPQADGSLLHRRFYTGYDCKLAMSYWENATTPACEDVATDMHDDMMRCLRSLQDGDGRLLWTPTGKAQRMFDAIRLLDRMTLRPQGSEQGLLLGASFTLDTPFPYAQDAAETVTDFSGSNLTQTLDNTGSAPFYPVWKIYGPIFYFTISNVTTGLDIIYDADLPGAVGIGGGDYAEIDTFRNTIYLNGDGANLKPGIDIENSDFFPLAVGDNQITVSGEGTFPAPDVDCLWQPAWA
jgi:hypothetical protein